MSRSYYIYIVTNYNNSVLYVGVTSNLVKRIYEHKEKLVEGFTKKYNVNKLVYYETFNDVNYAIAREKQLKAGSRKRKINLIKKFNAEWKDLYVDICN